MCNHPELFERADVTAPFSFSDFNQSYGLNREGNSLAVQYSSNSYLDVRLPKLLHLDPVGSRLKDTDHVGQLMNVWSKRHIARRLRDQGEQLDKPQMIVCRQRVALRITP